MATKTLDAQVLVGPRCLDDRICRLVYVRETDEFWTEEWGSGGWFRTQALVRHVLKAPSPKPAQLKKRGIPIELGEWDREQAYV
ncbi:MAG TPA: hypothetical protein VMN39_01000 [Longimicrobiaceae bacterium]|nr:hypothetical protein [Longimicrobiaceae bacterium]